MVVEPLQRWRENPPTNSMERPRGTDTTRLSNNLHNNLHQYTAQYRISNIPSSLDLRHLNWHKLECLNIFQFQFKERERIARLSSPHITCPGLNNVVKKCPQRAGTNTDSKAAEAEHEYEGCEDVDPEVDDDDH